MKLLIDIPEEEYLNYLKMIPAYPEGVFCYIEAIQQGTPLPKGHGRLIDADDLIQDIIDDSQSCIFNSECERIVHDKMVEFAIDRIAGALTIIEADKGEEE